MEQNREKNNQNGHPGAGYANGARRQNAEQGFEGMNYEQRREPYVPAGRQPNNTRSQEDAAGGSQREQDDRSPI